jgi:hypothetical protein
MFLRNMEITRNLPCIPRVQFQIYGRNTHRIGRRYATVSTGYGLDKEGIGIWFPAGTRNFSLFYGVQTGSGVQLASCPIDKGNSSPTDKLARA